MTQRYRTLTVILAALLCVGLGACNDTGEGTTPPDDDNGIVIGGDQQQYTVDLTKPVNVDPSAKPPLYLSAYNLFTWSQDEGFKYNPETEPYTLNIKLFSDYALKDRGIYIPDPENDPIEYEKRNTFDFPVGTLIWKTFYFADDLRDPHKNNTLVETRILVRTKDGWTANPYVWNADNTDAKLTPAGKQETISFTDPQGAARTASYSVPSRNMCASCHVVMVGQEKERFRPIGPKARHMNRENTYPDGETVNQLEHLADRGWLDGLPADMADVPKDFDFQVVLDDGVAALTDEQAEKAARDYLDINCAHCHNPDGVAGRTSQLFLNFDNTNLGKLGVCKQPGSAGPGKGGHTYDIVPGDGQHSILYFRVHTEKAGAMMPVVGRSLTHTVGAELVKRWIDDMEPNPQCPPETEP